MKNGKTFLERITQPSPKFFATITKISLVIAVALSAILVYFPESEWTQIGWTIVGVLSTLVPFLAKLPNMDEEELQEYINKNNPNSKK